MTTYEQDEIRHNTLHHYITYYIITTSLHPHYYSYTVAAVYMYTQHHRIH